MRTFESVPVDDPLPWLAVALMGGLVILLLSLPSGRADNARSDATEAGAVTVVGDDCGSGDDGGSGGGCD